MPCLQITRIRRTAKWEWVHVLCHTCGHEFENAIEWRIRCDGCAAQAITETLLEAYYIRLRGIAKRAANSATSGVLVEPDFT